MSKSFHYNKTSEINNIFLNPKIKQIIINFIYENLKPYSSYIAKEIKTHEDLKLLFDKNFYIQYQHTGEQSFLLFLRNKDRYYSCIINKKHLKNDPRDIILDDIHIIPFDITLELKIYDNTIFDGIYYTNKDTKEIKFFVQDVLLFRGENKIKDNIKNKLLELQSYFSHFKQNKIFINEISLISNLEEIYKSIKDTEINGIIFQYYNSGYSLYFNFISQHKEIKKIEKIKTSLQELKISTIEETKELKLKENTIKEVKNIIFSFTVRPQIQNKDLYNIYIGNVFVSNLFLNLDTHTKLIQQLKTGNNIIKARYNKVKKHWDYFGEDTKETEIEKIKYYFNF